MEVIQCFTRFDSKLSKQEVDRLSDRNHLSFRGNKLHVLIDPGIALFDLELRNLIMMFYFTTGTRVGPWVDLHHRVSINSPFRVTTPCGGDLYDDQESRDLGRIARIYREEAENGRTAAWLLAKASHSWKLMVDAAMHLRRR